jgi:uncharacterized protein YyaL (SSP411 family)
MAASLLERAPTAAGQMLLALEMFLGPTHEIVLLADPGRADIIPILCQLRGQFVPNKVVAMRSSKTTAQPKSQSALLDPLFAGKAPLTDEPTLYVCENFACQSPVTGRAAITDKLEQLAPKN